MSEQIKPVNIGAEAPTEDSSVSHHPCLESFETENLWTPLGEALQKTQTTGFVENVMKKYHSSLMTQLQNAEKIRHRRGCTFGRPGPASCCIR